MANTVIRTVSVDTAAAQKNLENLQKRFRELQGILVKAEQGSDSFNEAFTKAVDVKAQINTFSRTFAQGVKDVELAAAGATQQISEDVDKAALSFDQLRARQKLLKQEIGSTSFGSERFGELSTELTRVDGLLKEFTAQTRQASTFTERLAAALSMAQSEGTDRTIAGLEATVKELKVLQKQVDVTSDEFVQLGNALDGAQRELKQLNTTGAATAKGVSGIQKQLNEFGGAVKGAFAFSAALAAADALASGIRDLGAALVDSIAQSLKLRRELGQTFNATGDELTRLTGQAQGFLNTVEVDQQAYIEAVQSVQRNFSISATEAQRIVQESVIAAGVRGQEALDIFKEFPAQFDRAGFSASQFAATTVDQLNNGVFSNKGADAIKEFGLRVTEATQGTRDALLNAFGPEFTNRILGGVRSGVLSTRDALQQVGAEFQRVRPNAQATAQLFADVFGGAGEDAALPFLNSLTRVGQSLEQVTAEASGYTKAILELNEANIEAAEAQARFAENFEGLDTALSTALAGIKQFVFEGLNSLVDGFKAVIAAGDINRLRELGGVSEQTAQELGFTVDQIIKFQQAGVVAGDILKRLNTEIGDIGTEVLAGYNGTVVSAADALEKFRVSTLSALQDTLGFTGGLLALQPRLEAFNAQLQARQAELLAERQRAQQQANQAAAQQAEAAYQAELAALERNLRLRESAEREARLRGELSAAELETNLTRIEDLGQQQRLALLARYGKDASEIQNAILTEQVARQNEAQASADEFAAQLVQAQSARLTELRDVQNELDIESVQTELDNIQAREDALTEIARAAYEERAKLLAESKEREIDAANEIADARQANFELGINAGRSLLELIGQVADAEGENASLQRTLFNFNKALSVAEAIQNTALAVTQALTLPPPFGQIQAGIIGAAGAIQIAKIVATQPPKLARGGILNGPSHAEGGVMLGSGGRVFAEAEGGEVVLTKAVSQNPTLLRAAEAINVAAGGARFRGSRFMQGGGVVIDSPVTASMDSAMIAAIVQEVVSGMPPLVVSAVEITSAQNRVQVLESARG